MNFKTTIQNLIPGWSGKLMAHMVAWFGETSGGVEKVHRVSRYQSNNLTVVSNQLSLMQQMGFDGVCLTVQGPTVNPVLQEATIMIWEECMERDMLFAFVLDQWIAKGQPNPTQAVITALQSPSYQQILASPCYVPGGDILEFDLANSAGVDVATVQAAFPNNPILSWHTGYSWPNPPAQANSDTDLIAILKADNAKPTMKFAGVCLGFNNGGVPLPAGVMAPQFTGTRNYSLDVWGTGDATTDIDHQAGNYFLDQIAVTPATVPYICQVTWNDHDEQTAIEQFAAMFYGVRLGA